MEWDVDAAARCGNLLQTARLLPQPPAIYLTYPGLEASILLRT
jgi:hypothetical protein